MASGTTSIRCRSVSPSPRSATPFPAIIGADHLKKTNELLTQEVALLRARVVSLELELEKAKVEAQEESAKCRAANELIKSLRQQLETKKLPNGSGGVQVGRNTPSEKVNNRDQGRVRFRSKVDPLPRPAPRLVAEPPPPPQLTLTQPKQQPHRSNSTIPWDPNALFSGGGVSFLTGNRNARFSYGCSSFKGKRASMEDFYETRISEVDGQMVAFFGVFDGHGGPSTAEYLKNNLFKNLSSHPDFIKDTKSAIVEAFIQTDVNYLNEDKGQQKDAGSTASTAVVLGDRLLVANVGDSRVVASRAGSAIPLSTDHKPDRFDERQRIEDAGGFVMWAGTWRVGGVLAVSRAFGDKLLKPYVVAEPEIQEEEIQVLDFIIIASHGLWNVLSNEDAVTIVQDISDAEAASRKLIEEAYARGSADNITCVVVRFESVRESVH